MLAPKETSAAATVLGTIVEGSGPRYEIVGQVFATPPAFGYWLADIRINAKGDTERRMTLVVPKGLAADPEAVEQLARGPVLAQIRAFVRSTSDWHARTHPVYSTQGWALV